MNRKKTVGIMIGNICSLHSDEMLNGLVHQAKERDIQTIFFMGAHANCFDELHYFDGGNKEQKYIFQFNTIFDYVRLGKLDVLIVAYSTFYLYLDESKEDFLKRIASINIPVIIVGDEYKDYPSIISDNKDGIRKCMEHLIMEHGCKKIAYMSGPKENNSDSKERLEAYRDVMEENGLEILDGYIQYGDYSAKSAPLFGKILDKYPDIQAVVCANDTMALAGYEECRKRGRVPGADIAITGFDDITEAKFANPPLTTAEQNSYDLGYAAMRKAIDIIEGKHYDKEMVPVYFKHRESCGSKKEFKSNSNRLSKETSYSEVAEICSKRMIEASFSYVQNYVESKYVKDILFAVFLHMAEVYMGDKNEEFDVEFIDVSIRSVIGSNMILNGNFLIAFIKQMDQILFLNDNESKREKFSELILHCIDYIQNSTLIIQNSKFDNLQRNIWTAPFITRDMLANIDNQERMYTCIMERLRFMRINNAYLLLLSEPQINLSIADWKCPHELNLIAKIENGKISTQISGVKLNENNGLADMIQWENVNNMAAYSLFAGKWTYGILVCELTEDNITSMCSTSLHIGSAFEFIGLTMYQRKIQEELEVAMKKLTQTNSILNMMSEIDELTGLYNRRGFLENAMTIVTNGKAPYIVCMYADLDHLKTINDQFGHKEGDFAISKAAEYLKDSFRSTDVIGRIGGDEFAVVAAVKEKNMANELRDRIILKSKLFNQTSDKPYYVELSIGYVVYQWEAGMQLNEMLSAADVMLYENKLKKRKSVKK